MPSKLWWRERLSSTGRHCALSDHTRGIPLTGSQLAKRYAAIGAGFDAGDADVVCCQEVLTYWHLRLLVRQMRSFRRVSQRGQHTGGEVG